MKNLIKHVGLLLLLAGSSALASAKVQLPSYFTDNMVLQQNRRLTISGTAKPKRNVTLITSWDHSSYRVRSGADGSFSFDVQTPPAVGPSSLTFTAGEKLHLPDLMLGDSWF